jgi:hypothetical protein
MRAPEKPIELAQLHLPLLAVSKAVISNDQERELAVALVELLISAAQENEAGKTDGGHDEPETDR